MVKLAAPLALLFTFSASAQTLSPGQANSQRLGELFQGVMPKTEFHGKPTLHRPVFTKAHGCVKAQFNVSKDLPQHLRHGVFSQKGYPAWIRFSNDGPIRPDSEKTARGMSIKLVGVPGEKILDGERDAQTQDFVMQNHPIFFSDTAEHFLQFIEAVLSPDPSLKEKFDLEHPETERILAEMDKNVLADPLDGQYWTPTPYRLGPHAMKYMAKPCATPPAPETKPMTAKHFLRENLSTHLLSVKKEENICMSFWIQIQKDPVKMPIDKATVKWSETESPFIHAADILIPGEQDINDPKRDILCESLSFTGWHSLPEHEPLGSINQARKAVYKRIADVRRKRNGVAIKEPAVILPEE